MADSVLDRLHAYLAHCPGSQQGGRDKRTFEVACAAIERFDVPDDELLAALVEWDAANNEPPLRERQVRQRFVSARQKTAYDPEKSGQRRNGLVNGHANGHSERPRPRPVPAEPPAAPLPSRQELEDAQTILRNGKGAGCVKGREYLEGLGLDVQSLPWGLSKLADEEVGDYGLPRAAAGARFLVPVYLPDGTLGDVRRYRGPFGEGSDGDKMLPWAKGHGAAKPYRWWPLPEARELVWCEGEKDCEVLLAHGIPAVSHTCGASSARKVAEELDELLLAGRRFTVLFDHDDAGREAAAKLSTELLRRGAEALVATWPDVLPDGRQTPKGFDASDWFAAGFSAEELGRNLKCAHALDLEADTSDLPLIILSGRQLREKVADALAALVTANDPPALLVRGGQVTQIRCDERGWPAIAPVTVAGLLGRMAAVANWCRVMKGRDGEEFGVATDPPKGLAEVLLAAPEWPFPAVETVTQVPTMRPDGTLHRDPGYDAATRTYYVPPPGFELPEVPDLPTAEQVAAACDELHRPFAEFPWADDASYANLLALLLTAVVRTAIPGPVPLALIEAPQAGSGKSLLADATGIIAVGRAEFTTAPASREEWAKEIGTQLMSGRSIVAFDNVDGKLDNPDLAAVLTMEVWTKRQLGTNQSPALSQRATWIATGNNIRLGGDLPRRCYPIKLDAKCARPFEREGFAIADLRAYLHEHRGEILAALLTLARAWYAAGRPPCGRKPLGSFESWTRIVGGILQHAGVSGFLTNLDEMYATADDDGPVLETFLRAIHGAFGHAPWTVRSLTQRVADAEQGQLGDEADAAMREAVPDWLLVEGGKLSGIRLGKLLKANAGKRFGPDNVRVERDTNEGHVKVARWRVLRDDWAPAAPQPPPERTPLDPDDDDYTPWEDTDE